MQILKKMAVMAVLMVLMVTVNVSQAYVMPRAKLISTQALTYGESVDWMLEKGYAKGYANGDFGEDNCVNRAEFLKMLFEAFEYDEKAMEAPLFKDVPADAWFAPYIKTARARGLINGYSDGSFKPGQCVNRAEAAKIALTLYYGGKLVDSGDNYTYFEDIDKNSWYFPYLKQAFNLKAVGLDHVEDVNYSTYFKPGEGMTRKEVAEMLFRLRTIQDNFAVEYEEGMAPKAEMRANDVVMQTE
ncbi:S-layer homology domain-containing protein, partial [Patescibacteria group bacterium]|nr:S-layer homology domain-containing protein [Patescibacteria group bacterium]